MTASRDTDAVNKRRTITFPILFLFIQPKGNIADRRIVWSRDYPTQELWETLLNITPPLLPAPPIKQYDLPILYNQVNK
jgi:hypothetical protein